MGIFKKNISLITNESFVRALNITHSLSLYQKRIEEKEQNLKSYVKMINEFS